MPLFGFDDSGFFRPDSLSWVIAVLILVVVASVTAYSHRYLAGDRNQRIHLLLILLLGACVLCMGFADHLLVLLIAWTAGNLLLVRLMIHKGQWTAARNAGLLALKTFSIGFVCLALGFWLLAQSAGTALISQINSTQNASDKTAFAGLLLVAVAAMTQSAAWPFHRWLTSSLNSPTPVSALMHAGLVNGGGFLLVRLSPLYTSQGALLHILFMVGLVTAAIGTFWKLLQPDVKRMLACSTMGQMGFMLMQCGMGLFAPALSHLCWHGLFKAYLFLSAGSAVQEKRDNAQSQSMSPMRCVFAGLAGICGALAFSITSSIALDFTNTQCIMIGLAFMAATQLAVGLLQKPMGAVPMLFAPLLGLVAGALYGLNVFLIETAVASLHPPQPQPMDALYWAGFAVIFMVWVAMILNLPARLESLSLWKRLYMSALNASQPHPQTVTATRTVYRS